MVFEVIVPKQVISEMTKNSTGYEDSERQLLTYLQKKGIDTSKPFTKTFNPNGDYVFIQKQTIEAGKIYAGKLGTKMKTLHQQLEKEFFVRVVDHFAMVNNEQEKKGLKTYNQHLDPMDKKHDWLDMADEEMVDGYKYLQALRHELNETIHQCLVLLENTVGGTLEDNANIREVEKMLGRIQPKKVGE